MISLLTGMKVRSKSVEAFILWSGTRRSNIHNILILRTSSVQEKSNKNNSGLCLE